MSTSFSKPSLPLLSYTASAFLCAFGDRNARFRRHPLLAPMSSDRESFAFRVGISLVIHNRLEEVKKTLDSLSNAITDIDRVCLVDNASSNREDLDGLEKSYQQFHWIENSDNRGYAAAHHQALNWLMNKIVNIVCCSILI